MYDQYLEKLAEKFFRVGDVEDVFDAVRTHPPVRRHLRRQHGKTPRHTDAKGKPIKGVSRKRMSDDQLRGMSHGIAGTVHQDKKTGRRKVVLNKNVTSSKTFGKPMFGLPMTRRQLIAHEAFHAKAPRVIRDSETLAHIYGGVKGTKGGFRKKVKAGAQQYNHYSATRGRRAMRVPVAGGAALGGTVGAVLAKRRNKKIDKRKAAEGDKFDSKALKNRKVNSLAGGAAGAVLGGAAGALGSDRSRRAGENRMSRVAHEAVKGMKGKKW